MPNDNKPATSTPSTPVSKEPSSGGSFSFSDKQFKQLQRTLIYGSVIMGLIASGKRPTVSKANMQEASAYAEGILSLINDK